jgi:ketosteroid isomerase-like protein
MHKNVFSVLVVFIAVAGFASAAAASELDHIHDTVESWRLAWIHKDVEGYFEHYSASFRPKDQDYDAWRRQKREMLESPGPIEVDIRGLSVILDGSQARAQFFQRYRGPDHQDAGVKTLLLQRSEGRWLIQEERWRSVPGSEKPAPVAAASRPVSGIPPPTGISPNDFRHDLVEEKDRVCIRMNRFFIPKVFSLVESKPRIVVDIPDVHQWEGTDRREVNGPLVKRIRTYLHRDEDRLRVVLDLLPADAYAIDQTYYRGENVFCIVVK